MKREDYPEFQAIWIAACEIYGKTPSDAAMMMAFRALSRYDFPAIKRALDAHINDPDGGRFMPKPADLVRHIDGDPESRALEAWTKVEYAIKRIGNYQSIVFDDPLIMAVVEDLGGWTSLCLITIDEMKFKRNEFAKRYRGYLNRPPESYPRKLIGTIEAENQYRYSKAVPDPVLVGDERKALMVYQSGSVKRPGFITAREALKRLEGNRPALAVAGKERIGQVEENE